jgi:hypothetical protein
VAARITITGFAEAQRKLLELGREEWLRDSLEAGGNVLRDSIRALAPGSIKDLLVVKMARNPKVAIAYTAIDLKLSKKPPRKDGKRNRYPYIVEYGAGAHTITAVNLKALKLGGGRFADEVNHPGFAGIGYFRRGVRAGRGQAKTVIESMLQQAVQRLNNGVAA